MKASILLCLALTACAGQHGSARTTSAELANPSDEQVSYPSGVTIQLSPEIYQECNNVSARFSWDHTANAVQYRSELTAIASCLNRSSLQNERLLLVGRGHMFSREANNYALGMAHAHAIKTYLARAGLDPDRVDISSIGSGEGKADVLVMGAR